MRRHASNGNTLPIALQLACVQTLDITQRCKGLRTTGAKLATRLFLIWGKLIYADIYALHRWVMSRVCMQANLQPKRVHFTSCVVCKKSQVKSWGITRLSLNKPDIHLSFASTGPTNIRP